MISDIKAIDVHRHYTYGHPLEPVQGNSKNDVDSIKIMADMANIESVFVSPYVAVIGDNRDEAIIESNEHLADLVTKHDFLYQFVVIEPRIEETFNQARRMLESKKCVGIKLHPPFNNYNLEDYAKKIFDFAAQFNTVIQIHPQGFANHIVSWADKYPQLQFIQAHLSEHGQVEAIKQAKYGNVWTDTSSSSSMSNQLIEYAYREVGASRILFGTDGYANGAQRGRIEYALIPEEAKEDILRNNAMRLFGDKLK